MEMNRRKFVQTVGLGTASVGLAPILSSCSGENKIQEPDDAPLIQIGENIAVADTEYGKVKGYISRGIYTFSGIPYAADASGKNRFMPPQKHEPWSGVRPAVFYGNSAPQVVYPRIPTSYGAFMDHWNFDEISENCLCVNIWTPAIDSKKRPVIVWLHGGGYSNGNGIEQDGYNGENISRYGDVVYCSLNHRLGPIGFTDLSGIGGERYKDSGNVGLLDMLEALRWINRNIANFGGDPGNVTIIGQSGGGAKVCLMAAMPQAKGLIHKGVSLSGSTTQAIDKEYAQELGRYVVREAGLTANSIERLNDIPWSEYLPLARRAAQKLEQEKSFNIARGSFGPVADGIYLPTNRFFSDPAFGSPDIPMIFCTTTDESNPARSDITLENIDMGGVKEKLQSRFGEKAPSIVDAYAQVFPNKKPIEIWSMIVSSRKPVVESANYKLNQKSPVYMAWFGWYPPLFDGTIRAFHCLDICFWFYNTDLMMTHTGGGPRPQRLSTKMADGLLSFVRTGDPNCNALPSWPKYTAESGEVMLLNDQCEVKNDPDREARKALG